MTKRFQVTDNRDNPFLCDWSVTDYADGGIVHHPMTSENMANVMCDLLNELHEENKELQWKYNAQRRLFGQLNSDYNNYRLSAKDCQKQLKEENGELKKQFNRIRVENQQLRTKLYEKELKK